MACESHSDGGIVKDESKQMKAGGTLHIGVHQNDLVALDLHNKLSHQNLMSFSKTDMKVQSEVFTRWFENSKDTTYTLIINSKNNEVKAADVVFSLWLSYLKMNDENERRFFDFLKGDLPNISNSTDSNVADVFNEFPSIAIKNDTTVSFKLVYPNKWFPELLAAANVPVIKYSTFSKTGTYQGIGPFVLVGNDDGILKYAKNTEYKTILEEASKLPYLDSVLVHVYASRNQAITDFKSGSIDLLYGVPVKQARSFVEEYIAEFQNDIPLYNFDRFPEMSVYYYHLATTKKLKENKPLRQAISLGISREQILKEAIFDEAYSTAKNGLCPPIFRDYDQKALGFIESDENQAGYFFEAWKVNDLKGSNSELSISVLPLNDKSLRTGLEIQRQLLKKYDIQTELNEVGTFANFKQCDLAFGQVKAYFNSPTSVLVQFAPYFHETIIADTQLVSGFVSDKKYIESILLALNTKDAKEHAAFCLMAEKMLLEDYLIMPLWYGEKYRLIKNRVKNFKHNRFNVVDFGSIYIE